MKFFGTLYGKLALILFALIALMSVAYLIMAMVINRLHLEAVDQSLNEPLARNIIGHIWTNQSGPDVDDVDFREAVAGLMLVNPRIEVYLLDVDGTILSFSAPSGRVVRERVDLEPIRALISGSRDFPLRGEDPRDFDGQKVFSAAPVTKSGAVVGYIYAVLVSEAYDSTAEMFERDFILRHAVWLIAGAGIVTLIAGLVAFFLVTRRLRRLSDAILDFEGSDFRQPLADLHWPRSGQGDEIDQVGRTIEETSNRLSEHIAMLEEEENLRRELIANISHDLRTPLATLQGYIETISLKAEALSPDERKHFLELALKYAERLRRLIDELFELAILDTRDAVVEIEPFPLTELIQDVAQKFHFAARDKDIELTIFTAEKVPAVLGDLGLIERLIDNLIDNAIKYTQRGGSVKVTFAPREWSLRVEVADNGPGIPAEDLPQLTQRFYRVDRTRSHEPTGVGLGLAIAEKILKIHGSKLRVDSTLGQGSRFWFDLPIDRKDERGRPLTAEPQNRPISAGAAQRSPMTVRAG